MTKSNRGGNVGAADDGTTDRGDGATAQADGSAVAAASPTADNYTLVYRRDHPGNRCSYGVAGVSGIVVFDKGLFADGVAPASIELDVALAASKVDNKTARAAELARKAQEKADKAAQKLAASQQKAKERADAAAAKLAAAQAKLAAATGTAGASAGH